MRDAPTPESAAMMAEECPRLSARLADSDLEALALAKPEGDTNDKIAVQLGSSVRPVERGLHPCTTAASIDTAHTGVMRVWSTKWTMNWIGRRR